MPPIQPTITQVVRRQLGDVGGAIGGAANDVGAGVQTAAAGAGGAVETAAAGAGGAVETVANAPNAAISAGMDGATDKIADEASKQANAMMSEMWTKYGWIAWTILALVAILFAWCVFQNCCKVGGGSKRFKSCFGGSSKSDEGTHERRSDVAEVEKRDSRY